MIFESRASAGKLLASKLADSILADSLALAVSSGGLVVAKEIAQKLNCPLIDQKFSSLENKVVILVDDGIVTGKTILALIEQLRSQNPRQIIVASPVISKEALTLVQAKADQVIYLETPELFISLSEFYKEFPEITAEQVNQLLAASD